MKRTSFIQYAGGIVASLAAQVTAMARIRSAPRDKGFKVDAGKSRTGKNMSLFDGDTFFTKVSTRDTNGDLYVFESIRSNEGGPPLHFHYEQDEWWYVLQGEFLFQIGNEKFTAKAGDSIFGPRMIPHAFAKIGKGEARLLMLFQPAGRMEENFQAISDGVTATMTEDERKAFRQRNGMEMMGPPLTYLKQ